MSSVRLCVLGESFSGKTSLVKAYQELTDSKPCTKHLTIGAPNLFLFSPKVTELPTSFTVWDLPGEKRMMQLNATYFHQMDGFILTLDLTNASAMTTLKDYLVQLQQFGDFVNKPIVLACTKAESAAKYIAEVTIIEFLKQHPCINKYFYVSTVDQPESIKQLFAYTVSLCKTLPNKNKEMLLRISN